MSLRYRLDKERFKGKKLPPKIQTNEDHISPDQRGDHSSLDDPYSEGGIKHLLKQKLAQETGSMSRRGLFSGLNQLKQYSDEAEASLQPAAPTRKKKKSKKKRKTPAPENAAAESSPPVPEATPAGPDAPAAAEGTPPPSPGLEEPQPDAPRQGIFKRMIQHFFPPLEESTSRPPTQRANLPAADGAAEPAKPADAPDTPGAAPEPDSGQPQGAVDATAIPAAGQEDPAAAGQEDAPALEEEPAENELDRRNVLRQGIHFFAKPAVDKIQNKIDKVNAAVDKVTKRPPLLRPPGAISERQFLQACTRCDKCINACPKDAIFKVPKKMGFIIMDTPYIDPIKAPCVMCDDLPCISACPDKALLPVASKFEAKMGAIILDKKKCQAYGDSFCQQCLIDCPIPGAISQKDGRPVFHKDICTGCGVCVRSCST
ncbi:MAG: 4Fe-4S dicluster domain-containing protein, partial [Nitrospinaceae bacterium]